MSGVLFSAIAPLGYESLGHIRLGTICLASLGVVTNITQKRKKNATFKLRGYDEKFHVPSG